MTVARLSCSQVSQPRSDAALELVMARAKNPFAGLLWEGSNGACIGIKIDSVFFSMPMVGATYPFSRYVSTQRWKDERLYMKETDSRGS